MNVNAEQNVFLIVVTERKKKDAMLVALLESGIHLINTLYGKGTVNERYFLNTFGLIPEKNKAVITCVATRAKADNVMDKLNTKHEFEKPNAGIAFTIPVDKVVF